MSKEGEKRLNMLNKALKKEGIDFRPESYKWSLIQALLSRGDRRVTKLLLQVREYGDSAGSFRRAFKVTNMRWHHARSSYKNTIGSDNVLMPLGFARSLCVGSLTRFRHVDTYLLMCTAMYNLGECG